MFALKSNMLQKLKARLLAYPPVSLSINRAVPYGLDV
jgi:hypothetical protein